MKTIGFPISHKENEKRRALLPKDIKKIHHPEYLFFEKGYGDVMNIGDKDYINAGANIVSRSDVLTKDIICEPKIGDADYLDELKNKTIFGWIHALQKTDVKDIIIKNSLTAIAWENMNKFGRHVFWRNNEIAGEAAVMHAFLCFGKMPYDCVVAVIGRGNTAKGAINILNKLGAKVVVYNRKTQMLVHEEIERYDVIVNCVCWDNSRGDHIIYKSDLSNMKNHSMIIDVSCDNSGAIETSHQTTIENPTYNVCGVMHYVVDHTPSIYYYSFSEENSKVLVPYIQALQSETNNQVLDRSTIIKNGIVIDKE